MPWSAYTNTRRLCSFDLRGDPVAGRRPRPALSTGQDARRGMDRNEKKRLRERIGEHLDVSGARLTDDEALQLADLVDNYENYRGRTARRPRGTTAGAP